MAAKSPVTVLYDHSARVMTAVGYLSSTRVMVGVPGTKAVRSGGPITNAQIGYIHEHGAPEANIPTRPHLVPGVRSVQSSSTIPNLMAAGAAAFDGDLSKVEKYMSIAGQKAADAVRKTIRDRIPPPLSPRTLIGRVRRKAKYQKADAKRRATLRAAAIAGSEGDVPLFDTGQYARSITWVLRKKGAK